MIRLLQKATTGAPRARGGLVAWAVSLLLLLPLGLSGVFPVLARLASGAEVHVCHCAAHGGHTACACPICDPDRLDEDDPLAAAVTNPCGTESPAHHAALPPAVLPAPLCGATPVLARAAVPRSGSTVPHRLFAPPEPPPPRALRSLLPLA